MATTFTLFSDPISSPSAARNMSIDFTDALQAGESVSTQTVVSPDTDSLTISSISSEAAIVYFTMTTGSTEIDMSVVIDVNVTGSFGNSEHWKVLVPIVPYL